MNVRWTRTFRSAWQVKTLWDNDDAFCDTYVLTVTLLRLFVFHLCNYLCIYFKSRSQLRCCRSFNRNLQLAHRFYWYWTSVFFLSLKPDVEDVVRWTREVHWRMPLWSRQVRGEGSGDSNRFWLQVRVLLLLFWFAKFTNDNLKIDISFHWPLVWVPNWGSVTR